MLQNKKRVLVIIILVTVPMIIFFFASNRLDGTEKYAVSKVEQLIDMLKDPDSFKLRNDVLVIEADDDGKLNRYTYITYSANNSYGASIKSTAIFFNYSYLGDADDEADDFNDLTDKINFLNAKLNLIAWNLSGENAHENWISADLVSAKKIAHHLHVNYVP